jgi:hypothetical protein
MRHLSILDRMPTSLESDVRCTRCGCAIDPNAFACAACGAACGVSASSAPSSAPSSAGALGDRRYETPPAPVAQYDIALGATASLAATFKLWSENLARLSVLGFVPYALLIPLAGAGALAAMAPSDTFGNLDGFDGMWPLLVAGGVAVGALFMVLAFASMGACVHVVDEKTQGVDVPVITALLASLKHVGWLFVAYLVLGVLMTAAVAVPAVPLIWGMSEDSYAIASLALPLCAVTAGLFVMCARLLPTLPIIVVEDRDAFTALSRAWRLTSGRTTTVVCAALLFGLAYFGVSMAVAMIGIVPIVGALVQMAANAVLVPLCYVFAFVVYAGCVREESSMQRG